MFYESLEQEVAATSSEESTMEETEVAAVTEETPVMESESTIVEGDLFSYSCASLIYPNFQTRKPCNYEKDNRWPVKYFCEETK